ncbi:S1C family serine protease [Cyanobium sp. WAJ14-Wanaka]|uniref:S1C family serine protease n=1 Tax=Cyanobium sp. WAJ14-Wanaka TaxID=2823725 RepID=UPI0020CD90B6|nr:trypsin-like peptidase domain-containing protein [Cyanobium sp. WAJ14-Wanaka]MCP9775993.1 trypsin-like peptidase domain-containing protein [Cyanobium sp. WAJ14-Wanaka]
MKTTAVVIGFLLSTAIASPSIAQQPIDTPSSAVPAPGEPPFTKELPNDIDWKSPQETPPYSTILKIKSAFDGSAEYVVFDKDWRNNMNGTETGIRTRWSSDKLEGQIYLKAGCGILACPFGSIIDIRGLPSPIVISSGGQEFRIYGEDGEFILPTAFGKSLAEIATSVTVKIGESGKTFTLGKGSVDALKKLFLAISTKEEPPKFILSAEPLQQKSTSFQKQVASALTRVVGIKSPKGSGTAFVAESTGILLTNRHVVGSSKKIEVTYSDGTKKDGDVIFKDREIDLAVIKVVSPPKISPLPLCYATYPKPAEDVIVLGNPLGLANTVTKGIVSALRRSDGDLKSVTPEGTTLIQTDAAINPGNSGGPMLNQDGEVIGIVSFKKSSGEGTGFAISIVDALQAMKVKKPGIAKNLAISECGNLIPSVSNKVKK